MFELLKPNKLEVGKRLREVKDELDVSFAEFGNRLGLIKPTINAYVRGDNLAPIEVIEKVSKISGKPIGWFYFGEMEDYIKAYLVLLGKEELVNDYPDFPLKIKEELLDIKKNPVIKTEIGNKIITQHRNPNWENEFGYPKESYLDELYNDHYVKFMKEYLKVKTREAIDQLDTISEQDKEELFAYAFSNAWGYFFEIERIDYPDRERLVSIIDDRVKEWKKKTDDDLPMISDEYLVGKLINDLKTVEDTEEIIGLLSQVLTGHHFSTFFGGDELVRIFQSMRPKLLELYVEKTDDDFYEWFEK